MSEIKYEDTTHKALGLIVAENDLDVTNLSIIERKVIGDIEIGVLGASHYIKVRDNDNILTEVFACKSISGADYQPLSVLDDDIENEYKGFMYSFNQLTFEGDEVDGIINLYDLLYDGDSENGLKVEFPTNDVVQFPPVTYVQITQNIEKYLEVITLHAYPEENVVVTTETKIKFK
jgi:hypothetical protein